MLLIRVIWYAVGRPRTHPGVELSARFLGWEEVLGKIPHTSGTIAAPCLQRCCIGSFFHVNTCSLGNGPRLPKSSQMAWILYPCQSALEFNNNREVKLGPFLVANPQNHLAFPFLWKTVECMCWGEGGGWGWKKRNRPILSFLKDNPLSVQIEVLGRRISKLVSHSVHIFAS